MGKRYLVETNEIIEYPLSNSPTTSYYVDNLWQVLKLLVKKKGKILYITRWFY